MAAKNTDQPSAKHGLLNDAKSKLIAGLIAALFVVVSPLSDWARDWVEARLGQNDVTVTGTLRRDGFILAGADVTVRDVESSDSFTDVTNNSGQYLFADISPGRTYEMDVRHGGMSLVAGHLVPIPEDQNPYTVEILDVAHIQVIQQAPIQSDTRGEVVNTAYEEDSANAVAPSGDDAGSQDDAPLPPIQPLEPTEETGMFATPMAGNGEQDIIDYAFRTDVDLVYSVTMGDTMNGAQMWNVTVGIEPSGSQIGIESVTYYLDPAFEPAVVTRYRSNNFSLDFSTASGFQIGAIVTFTDGSQEVLNEYLDVAP